MKLLGSTKSKITKNENGQNVIHLKISPLVQKLIHCNIVNNDYQHDSWVLYRFVPDKSFGQFWSIVWYVFKNLYQNFHIMKWNLLIKTARDRG